MSGTALPHDGWIVVADGEKALFLFNEGDEVYPNLKVFKELEHENPPSHDQGSDKPGRLSDASRNHRSAVENTDWHRVEKERFASEISGTLYKYAHAHRFKNLILVAPPQVLGDLRQKIHSEVAECIVATVPKDLTGHPIDQIERIVLN